MRTAWVSAAVLLSALAASQPARADDLAVELHGTALQGKDRTALVAHANANVAGLSLELAASDGRTVRRASGRLARGREATFDLGQERAGTVHYRGTLVARFPHGPPQELPLEFDATVVAPLALERKSIDLDRRTETLVANFDAAKMHVRVVADDGSTPVDEDRPLGVKARTPFDLTWPALDGRRVLKVDVQVFDRFGYWTGRELSPWRIEIPHEDVLFDNGKAELLDAERPKLDAAYATLAKELARYGKVAKVELFVGGCTDTVGDRAANQRLSEARALAIARYFRKKGARIPISYAGYGEDGLLVATPDETPEPRNRRATYVVSIEPPPGAKWIRLR